MGDVAMTVPVVARLRKDYPEVRITVLTRGRFAVFFRDIPRIEFFTPDLDGHHGSLPGLLRLARDLYKLGVDAVADLHDVLRTQVVRTLLGLMGVRVAVIDKGRFEKRMLTRRFRKMRQQLTPSVERYREVFARLCMPLGELSAPVRNPAPLSEKAVALAGAKTGVWVGVAPFAQHRGKVYPTILSDALIGLLAERYQRVFVFGGGRHELDFGECMQGRYDNVTSVVGKLPLEDELDLISNIDCMVTMDSASMHMASLVATPVVSVWGATHPFAGFYGFGQDQANAVQLDMDCRPCSVYGNRPCQFGDYRCMERIPPATIAAQVAKVVGRK